MSVEHHPESVERTEQATAELEAARAERLAELRQSAETDADSPEQRAEAAREAIAGHEQAPTPDAAETHPRPAQRPHFDPKLSYRQTMASLRRQLGPVSRRFSQVIHTPIIEKTSEKLENTIARPSVVFGATWTAVIVGGIFYFTARSYGYPLSGSELLFSFLIGGLLGVVIEGLWRAIRRQR
jgi:hypothetical protein